MDVVVLIIFSLAYLGIALGEIPGLKLDRTGFALLGALAMLVSGALSLESAVAAIDVRTLILLYSLMIVSAQLRLGGFYTHVARALVVTVERPRLFLAQLMGASAILSAVLANDIVCLAFTPVLIAMLMRAGRDPIPYLLGLAIASNIGSAATIIGNPQNMLIGQLGHLLFGKFLLWCGVPAIVSLLLAYGLVLYIHRDAWGKASHAPRDEVGQWPVYDRWQSQKGLFVLFLLVSAFFTSVPRECSALAAAGLLMCSRRMATRSLLGLVDWHLITLFIGLFVIIHAVESTGLSSRVLLWLRDAGFDPLQPLGLSMLSVALSNLVSNVPAVMLLVKWLPQGEASLWYVLAVSSTFAGNLITVGSLANLIVIEQARMSGIEISFRAHARVGIPVTLATLAVLALWCAWVM